MKVQRPGLEDAFQRDLNVIKGLVNLLIFLNPPVGYILESFCSDNLLVMLITTPVMINNVQS